MIRPLVLGRWTRYCCETRPHPLQKQRGLRCSVLLSPSASRTFPRDTTQRRLLPGGSSFLKRVPGQNIFFLFSYAGKLNWTILGVEFLFFKPREKFDAANMQLFLPESGPGPFICRNQPCLRSRASLAPDQLPSPLKQLQPKSSRTSILGQKHPTRKMCFHQKAPWLPKDTGHCQLSPEHRDWEAFRDTQSVLMKTNRSPRWQLGVSPRERLRSKSCAWQRRERWGPCWVLMGRGAGREGGDCCAKAVSSGAQDL